MATVCVRISDAQLQRAKEIANYKSIYEGKKVSVSSLLRKAVDGVFSQNALDLIEVEVIAMMHSKAKNNPHVKHDE